MFASGPTSQRNCDNFAPFRRGWAIAAGVGLTPGLGSFYEHTFGVPPAAPMHDEPVITRATALAERILEEVSRADQDWRLVAAWTHELGELARGLTDPLVRQEPAGRQEPGVP